MHCAILPVLHIGGNWGHSAGSDGLWPLCGHLWPAALWFTMSQDLCVELVSCCYLSGAMCSLIHCKLSSSGPILQIEYDHPLLCDLPSLVSCLLWCVCESVDAMHWGHFLWDHHHHGHPHTLLVYSHHHPEVVRLQRESAKPFSPVPPTLQPSLSYRERPFSFIARPILATAWVQSIHGVLHCSDPHAESTDLQSGGTRMDVKEALRKVGELQNIILENIFLAELRVRNWGWKRVIMIAVLKGQNWIR